MDQRKNKIKKAAITPKSGFFKSLTKPFYHLYRLGWPLWVILPIVLVVIRSINLLGLPLYLDEGIYIAWAGLFSMDQSYAYSPLNDGKAPLFMWLTSFFNQYLHDFLLSGRLISVFAGAVTLISWMIILRLEVGKRFVAIFWLIFLIIPYGFLIERMAFVDSLLSALISLGTLCLVWSFKTSLKVWWVLILSGLLAGLSMGLAYLAKTSARAFLVILFILAAFWIVRSAVLKKYSNIVAIITSVGIMYLTYREIVSDFRIGAQRYWGMINIKEGELTYSLTQIFGTFFIHHNFIFVYKDSLPFFFGYMESYFSLSIILAAFGVYWILRNRKDLIWIFIYFLVATLGIFLSARMMSSRYFYPTVPSFLALATLGSIQLWEKVRFGKVILISILAALAIQSSLFLIKPLQAIYSYDDKGFFVTGNLSALGLSDIQKELKTSSETNILGVSGIWGVPDGVETELSEENIKVVTLNNWLGESSVNLDNLTSDPRPNKYLYLTLDEKNALPILGQYYFYTIINEFPRPESLSKVYLIKLNSKKSL